MLGNNGLKSAIIRLSNASGLRRRSELALDSVGHIDAARAAIGRTESWNRRYVLPGDLRAAEFRVFSQWNEDGIVQHLIRHVPISEPSFVEFGVGSYEESNTRFLVTNDNWRGLVMDIRPYFRSFLEKSELLWRHDISTRAIKIDARNFNAVLEEAGFLGDIGLMSIDVDSNDYWLWEALEVAWPRIIVCEYNSTFGVELPVVVPYDAEFNMQRDHPSYLYFGASLPALCHLATEKGYRFVGCESHGANCFFVRGNLQSDIPTADPELAYVYGRFRSSRRGGELTYISGRKERLRAMSSEYLQNVVTGECSTVGDLFL